MLTIGSITINFAWYQLLTKLDQAYKTPIQKGSYANDDYRLQFESVSIEIDQPYHDMIPILPVGCEGIQPTTMEYVEQYFQNYIIGRHVNENETYTYGQRINISLRSVLENLKRFPYNNQIIFEIGKPNDIFISDPPCLRLIDVKVNKDRGINLHCYFRSWELWAGFPTNLAAIEMLRQYLSHECGFEMEKGKLFAYSSGLHIYGENVKNVQAVLKKNILLGD